MTETIGSDNASTSSTSSAISGDDRVAQAQTEAQLLMNTLLEKTVTVSELSKQNESLKTNIQRIMSEYNRLKEEQQTHHTAIVKLKRVIQILCDDNNDGKGEEGDSSDDKDTLETIQDIKTSLKRHFDEVQQLNDKCKIQEETIETLQSKLTTPKEPQRIPNHPRHPESPATAAGAPWTPSKSRRVFKYPESPTAMSSPTTTSPPITPPPPLSPTPTHYATTTSTTVTPPSDGGDNSRGLRNRAVPSPQQIQYDGNNLNKDHHAPSSPTKRASTTTSRTSSAPSPTSPSRKSPTTPSTQQQQQKRGRPSLRDRIASARSAARSLSRGRNRNPRINNHRRLQQQAIEQQQQQQQREHQHAELSPSSSKERPSRRDRIVPIYGGQANNRPNTSRPRSSSASRRTSSAARRGARGSSLNGPRAVVKGDVRIAGGADAGAGAIGQRNASGRAPPSSSNCKNSINHDAFSSSLNNITQLQPQNSNRNNPNQPKSIKKMSKSSSDIDFDLSFSDLAAMSVLPPSSTTSKQRNNNHSSNRLLPPTGTMTSPRGGERRSRRSIRSGINNGRQQQLQQQRKTSSPLRSQDDILNSFVAKAEAVSPHTNSNSGVKKLRPPSRVVEEGRNNQSLHQCLRRKQSLQEEDIMNAFMMAPTTTTKECNNETSPSKPKRVRAADSSKQKGTLGSFLVSNSSSTSSSTYEKKIATSSSAGQQSLDSFILWVDSMQENNHQ